MRFTVLHKHELIQHLSRVYCFYIIDMQAAKFALITACFVGIALPILMLKCI